MMADEYEGDTDDGPIETLFSQFSARDWATERLGPDEVVATVPGSWAQYELRAVWREPDQVLQFLALPDIRVAADKRATIQETIGLINEQLWLGHFELWSTTGMVIFRHAALLDTNGETALTEDQATTLVETAVDECERFYPVFQFVLWGGKSPAEAIAAALIETHGEA